MRKFSFLCVLCMLCLILNDALNRMPVPASIYPRQGIASWYEASVTATQEPVQENGFTCALRRRDFGRSYRVCNLSNGKCVVVRHNDWGPYWVLFNQGRIVDLSKHAFAEIEDLNKGLTRVSLCEIPCSDNTVSQRGR